ncbi:unnamed protein product [Cunninghamella blakesleeana]
MKFSIVSIFILVIFFLIIQVNGESTETMSTDMNHPHVMTLLPRKATNLVWATPEILVNGTLFYIAISISTLLWCTGKGLIMTIDQQERKANYLSTK